MISENKIKTGALMCYDKKGVFVGNMFVQAKQEIKKGFVFVPSQSDKIFQITDEIKKAFFMLSKSQKYLNTIKKLITNF